MLQETYSQLQFPPVQPQRIRVPTYNDTVSELMMTEVLYRQMVHDAQNAKNHYNLINQRGPSSPVVHSPVNSPNELPHWQERSNHQAQEQFIQAVPIAASPRAQSVSPNSISPRGSPPQYLQAKPLHSESPSQDRPDLVAQAAVSALEAAVAAEASKASSNNAGSGRRHSPTLMRSNSMRGPLRNANNAPHNPSRGPSKLKRCGSLQSKVGAMGGNGSGGGDSQTSRRNNGADKVAIDAALALEKAVAQEATHRQQNKSFQAPAPPPAHRPLPPSPHHHQQQQQQQQPAPPAAAQHSYIATAQYLFATSNASGSHQQPMSPNLNHNAPEFQPAWLQPAATSSLQQQQQHQQHHQHHNGWNLPTYPRSFEGPSNNTNPGHGHHQPRYDMQTTTGLGRSRSMEVPVRSYNDDFFNLPDENIFEEVVHSDGMEAEDNKSCPSGSYSERSSESDLSDLFSGLADGDDISKMLGDLSVQTLGLTASA